jgi:hypothetical protein
MLSMRAAVRGCLSGFGFLLIVSGAIAQTTVTTSGGAANSFPVFTGSSSIGSSTITEVGPNVGIGTSSPGATLDVNGSINASGTATLSGLIFNNQVWLTDPSTSNSYRIATLPASSVSTLDHLHLLVTLDLGWAGSQNSYLDITFGNRGAFSYQYTLKGAPVNPAATIRAYLNSNGSVDIFLCFAANTYTDFTYTVLENVQETIYPPSVADTPTAPAGTVVFDASSSSYPPAMYLANGGNVGIGTAAPGASLEVNGNVKLSAGSGAAITFADGTVQSTAYTGVACGGDYAESVDVDDDPHHYAPGDVLVVSDNTKSDVEKSQMPYSTEVVGVYSTKPGYVGRRFTGPKSKQEVPMAMIGIVPIKVTTENGPIRRGDLLVTSSISGYAMKGTDRSRMLGAVVGKALGRLDSGKGVIEAVITLQ